MALDLRPKYMDKMHPPRVSRAPVAKCVAREMYDGETCVSHEEQQTTAAARRVSPFWCLPAVNRLCLQMLVLLAALFAQVSSQPSAAELAALGSFFNAFNGKNWVIPRNRGAAWHFGGGGNPCTQRWVGITCSSDGKRVQSINLSGVRCASTIPSSIGQLSALTALSTLNLGKTMARGSIPPSIGSLSGLTQLWLAQNSLVGKLPDALWSLRSCVFINLGVNRLSGSLSSQIQLMSRLKTLWLNRNSLTGSIPIQLYRLPAILNVALSQNRLRGGLSSEIGSIGRRLVQFNVDRNFLRGSLPSALGNLVGLTSLGLFGSSNVWSGTLPSEIGRLSKLVSLRLDRGRVFGSIPASIGGMTSLTMISISETSMSGTVPTIIGTLSRLASVFLEMNRFSGSIPASIFALPRLRFLDLRDNKFVSTLPNTMGCTALRALRLDDNSIRGTLPSAMGGLSSLTLLTTSSNLLSGSVPWIGQLRQLRLLNLDLNKFTGALPASIGGLSALTEIRMKSNAFTGPLFPLDRLLNLESIVLADNKLTGTLSAAIGRLTDLEYIGLEGNSLSGQLPTSLGDLSFLTHLSLRLNSFSGSIPAELGRLKKLLHLDIEGTKGNTLTRGGLITGTVPTSLAALASLQYLSVGYNALTGSLPAFVGSLRNLSSLKVHSNRFIGAVPAQWAGLLKLKELFLSTNDLSGALPSFLGLMPALQIIFAFENRFSGPLPSSLGQLKKLNYFWCHNNNFTGTVPASFRDLLQIKSITLQKNRLTGPVSPFLGTWPNLIALQLHNNGFTSTVPSAIAGFSSLKYLTLQENCFTGVLPAQLSALKNLTLLNVSVNNLVGTLPDSYGQPFGALTRLQYFDCSFNALSGTLPVTYNRLSALKYFFAESNRFVGGIPQEWGTEGGLGSLQQLRLRNNLLSGSISSQLGALSSLQKLYLSNNSFSSTIPSDLAGLTSMTNLFLDHNRLTGSLSPSLFASWRKLSKLRVGYNSLRGALPDTLYSLSGLASIQIQHNAFEGSLSSSISQLQALKRLMVSFNSFSSTIPSALGSVTGLFFISVAANSMTGTLPPQLSSLGRLTYLDVSKNSFASSASGGLEWINAQTMPTLEYIDVSANNFSGSVPVGLFSIPTLRSAVLAENCMQGPLPETICQATNLKDLILDGLAAGQGCQRPLWTRGSSLGFDATLAGTLSGSVPPCVWRLPLLRQLHLAGNGLSGRIDPSLLSWPANLTDLTLANNRFSHPIPPSLQSHAGRLSKLDLSRNKFNGSCFDMQLPSSLLHLEVNRLSGSVPSSLYPNRPMQSYSILAGNFWDCRDPQQDFSPQDPHLNSFQCGSSTMNNYILAYLIIVVAAVGAAWVRLGGIGALKMGWNVAAVLGASSQVPQVETFVAVGERVKRAVATLLVLHLLILVPAYGALSARSTSHTYSYIWTVSGAFKTGSGAATYMFFVLSASAMGVFALSLSQAAVVSPGRGLSPCFSGARGGPDLRKASLSANGPYNQRKTWSDPAILAILLLRLLLIFTFNSVTVVGANLAFFYVFRSATVSQKTGAQLLMSVFNALWGKVVVARLLRARFLFCGLHTRDILHAATRLPLIAYCREREGFTALMAVVSQILAPIMASLVVNPNCFLALFYQSAPATSSYADTFTYAENLDTVGQNFDPRTQRLFFAPKNFTIMVSEQVTNSLSFVAPFQYFYQCSSAILVSYAPVLLNGAIIRAFVFPLLRLALRALLTKWAAASYPATGFVYGRMLQLLPRLVWTRAEREATLLLAISSLCQEDASEGHVLAPGSEAFERRHKHALHDARQVLDRSAFYVDVVNDVAVLGSFGAVCPLLGAALGVTIYLRVALLNRQLGAFVCSAGLPDGTGARAEELRQLELDCAFDGEGSPLFHSRWMVLTISLCFFAFFIFDAAGDEQGAAAALWAPLVQVFVPLVLAGLIELCYRSGLLAVSTRGQPSLPHSALSGPAGSGFEMALRRPSSGSSGKAQQSARSVVMSSSSVSESQAACPDQGRWMAREWEVGRASISLTGAEAKAPAIDRASNRL